MKKISAVLVCFLLIFVAGCAEKGIEPRQEMPAVVPLVEPEVTPAPSVLKTVEVDITADKVMVPNMLEIKRGTTVRWYNRETKFNHNLVIYSADVERLTKVDVIVQSGNIAPGNYWEYTFREAGEYKVKDIYSTAMVEITADVISEILEKGEIIGTISVE